MAKKAQPNKKQQPNASEDWPAWPQPNQHEALVQWATRKPAKLYRGLSFKFHKPTWRRAQNILWSAKHNTNLVVAILENLREDYHVYRDDGAFESIHQLLLRRAERSEVGESSGKPTRLLMTILEERFHPPEDERRKKKTVSRSKVDSELQKRKVATPPRATRDRPPRLVLDTRQFPIIWTLRRGAFAQAALPLLLFYIQIQRYIRELAAKEQPDSAQEQEATAPDEQENEAQLLGEEGTFESESDDLEEVEAGTYPNSLAEVPSVQALHAMWSHVWSRYEQSAKCKIPFGRNRDKAFGEGLAPRRIRRGKRQGRLLRTPGKRRVRWLRDQLFTIDQVTQALADVYVLLNADGYSADAVHAAKASRHLWRNDEQYQKSPRADYYSRYRRSAKRAKTTLGALYNNELLIYESELLDKLDHAREFAKIREDVDIYLAGAPPSYPTIEPALFDDTSERAAHMRSLEHVRLSLQTAVARQKDSSLHEVYKQASFAEKLRREEVDAITDLLRAESEAGERALLPLRYTRTMRPPKPNPSFALLYERVKLDAQTLRKRFGTMPEPEQNTRVAKLLSAGTVFHYTLAIVIHHSKYAFIGDHPADYFAPNIEPGRFFYVNFPDVVFVPPPNTSLLTFPLELGEDYHNSMLWDFIERERHGQKGEGVEQAQTTAPKLPKNAGIGEAKILVRRNGRGWYSFFLNVAVPIIPPAETRESAAILGLTCIEQRYFWSLIDLTGKELKSGELEVPRHVRPWESVGIYSENYPPEIARTVCTLADETNALIGVDKTWERKRVIAQAGDNRRVLLHPDRKVADYICEKALEVGLVRPWFVYGVSPSRCGSCGNKAKNERQLQQITQCITCGSARLSSILHVPLARYDSDMLIATIRWEIHEAVHAQALSDLLAWLIGEAPHQDCQGTRLPELLRRHSLASLEWLTSDGRQMFHQQRVAHTLSEAPVRDFQPRKRRTSIRVATPTKYHESLPHLLSAYAAIATTVHIELLEYSKMLDPAVLYERDFDVVIHGSDEQPFGPFDAKLAGTSLLCNGCGRINMQRERWFTCTSQACQRQERDEINRARLIARLTLNQLVSIDYQKA